jgi:alpha-L-rhamnosidase
MDVNVVVFYFTFMPRLNENSPGKSSFWYRDIMLPDGYRTFPRTKFAERRQAGEAPAQGAVTRLGRLWRRMRLAALGLLLGAAAAPAFATAPFAPTNLVVDDVANPVGTEAVPYFGWLDNNTNANEIQSAYEILVASSMNNINANDGDVWDSGEVASSRENHVVYTGATTLTADTEYYWKVRTWDREGLASPYSTNATFTVGLLANGNWSSASWIAGTNSPADNYTYYRKWTGTLSATSVQRATVYITSVHKYVLYVNGTLVGKGPAYAFPQYQFYNAYDITGLITPGTTNLFAIFNHWFGGGSGRDASSPGILMQANIHYTDGTSTNIGTDGTWLQSQATNWATGQAARGGSGDGYIEKIYAGTLPTNWFTTNFNASGWAAPTVIGGQPNSTWPGPLLPDLTRIVETVVTPVSVTMDQSGNAYVVDLGKLHSGVPVISFTGGTTGTTINMGGGFALLASGDIDASQNQSTTMTYYTVLNGSPFTYQPVEYLTMRYFAITNPPMAVTTANFSFVERNSQMNDASSSFTSPNATLNNVWGLMKETLPIDAQEEFIDSMRQKGGFLGDGFQESLAAMEVEDERPLTRRRLNEFIESMVEFWATPATNVGRVNACYPDNENSRDIPDYTQMYLDWVWEYYMQTGDLAFLGTNYTQLTNIAQYVNRDLNPATGLITNLLGGTQNGAISTSYEYGIIDWPPDMQFGYDLNTVRGSGPCSATVINGWAWEDYDIVSRIAGELGNTTDSNTYRGMANSLSNAINTKLLNSSGVYVDGLDPGAVQSTHASQHANAFPLSLNIVPAAQQASVTAQVDSLGMSVSALGILQLVRGLGEANQGPALLNLYTNASQYGWAQILSFGGTATWESWTANTDGDSESHGWGAVGLDGYVRYILGVKPLTAQFGQVQIMPLDFGTNLASASGTLTTDRGAISVEWDRSAALYHLAVTIPVNVTATVYVPQAGVAGTAVYVDGANVIGTVTNLGGTTNGYLGVAGLGSGAHNIERVLEYGWTNTITASPQGWNINANWNNGIAFANSSQAVAIISNGITANQSITLNQSITVGSLEIGAPGGSYNIAANGGTLTLDNTPAAACVLELSTSQGDTISAPIINNGSLAITNYSANTLTLSGNLSGAANGLMVNGSVTLSGVNTYSGGTTISGGTLLIGGAGELGGGAYGGAIANAGTLTFNSSAAQNLSGTISGTGALNQTGNGSLTLSGANTYTGPTTITGGTLFLSGDGTSTGLLQKTPAIVVNSPGVLDSTRLAHDSGALDIGDGSISEGAQSLSGNGAINGSVIINSSGTLSPGLAQGAYGNLTIANALTVSNVVNMYVDHPASGAANDSVTAQSINIYAGSTINVVQSTNDLQAGDSFQLFNSPNLNPNNVNLGGVTIILPKNGPVAHGIYAWNTNNLAAKGTLQLVSVTPPATPVITWGAPAAISYGTALSASQLDATANVPGSSFAYNPPGGTVLNAGTATLTVVFTPTDTVDYTSATQTVSLVVSPGLLTYVANRVSRPVGTANPTFTGTVTGFVNGDTQASATKGTLAFTTPATTTSPAGSYPINGSGLSASNYTFVQAAGNATALTIATTVTQVKAANTTALNTGGSWVSGIVPGAGDTAEWTSVATATGDTLTSMGGAFSVGEIQVAGGASSPLTAVSLTDSTATDTLTLNAVNGVGIDMSQASQNLTLAVPVVLAASQAWNLASGTTLTLGGANEWNYGANVLTISGPAGGTAAVVYNPNGSSGQASSSTGAGLTLNNIALSCAQVGSSGVNSTNEFGANTALTMAGSSLTVSVASNSGHAYQIFPSLALNPGSSAFYVLSRSAFSGQCIGFATVTRNAGSIVDFGANNGTTGFSSTANQMAYAVAGTTVLGYATYAGNDWLLPQGSTTITMAASYSGPPWASANNVTITTATDTETGAKCNSLIFKTLVAGGITETLSGVNTIVTGGILVGGAVGANAVTITGGTLTSGNTTADGFHDLIIINNNNNLNSATTAGGPVIINSVIADNAASGFSVGLTAGTGTNLANGTFVNVGPIELGGANTFTGTTYIPKGTLQLNNALALQNSTFNTSLAGSLSFGSLSAATLGGLTGTGNLTLPNNFALTLGNATSTYSSVLGGAGATLTKAGPGTLTLGGFNTYSGGTTVTSGTLLVANTSGSGTGTGSVTVYGGILGGSGTISGSVTVGSGGQTFPSGGVGLAGGVSNTIGGNLTYTSGAAVPTNANFNLSSSASGPGNDQIIVNGASSVLNCGGSGAVSVGINCGFSLDTHNYVLFNLTGGTATITGSFNATPVWLGDTPANAADYSVATIGTTVVLKYQTGLPPTISAESYSPVPLVANQPATFSATVIAGGAPLSTVTVNLAPLGGTLVTLVSDGMGDYTNTVPVPYSASPGNHTLVVEAKDTGTGDTTTNLLVTVAAAAGATETWNGADFGNSPNWSDGNNWASTSAPGFGDNIYFDGSVGLAPVMNNSYSMAGVTFNSTAGSFTIANAGGGQSLTLTGGVTNNSANAQTLSMPVALNALTVPVTDAGSGVVLSGVVSGSGEGLATTGKVTLGAANTFSGTTTISSGTLLLNNGLALQNSTLNNVGGALSFGVLTAATIGALSGTQNLALQNATPAAVNLTVGGNNTSQIFSGALSDGGLGATLTMSGTGTQTLSGANTYTGDTAITGGGTLAIGGSGQLGGGNYAGAISDVGVFSYASSAAQTLTGIISGTGGSLSVTGAGPLTLSGVNSYSGATTIGGGSTLIVSGGGKLGGGTYLGNIADNGTFTYASSAAQTLSGTISGSGTFNQNGGTLTLSGANTFSGTTTIGTGSTLLLANTLALQDSTLNYTGTGTLNFGTLSSASLGGLSGSENLLLANTASTPAAVALTIGLNNANTSYSGNLTDSPSGTSLGGSVFKQGTGTLTLSGQNTYTGQTQVEVGTLIIAGSGVLGGGNYSAALPVSGVFNYNSSANQVLSGSITASGSLQMTGTGTLTLSGANTYTGGTTITAGILSISADGGLGGDQNLVMTGGDLLGTTASFALSSSRGVLIGPANSSVTSTASIDSAATVTFTVPGVIAPNTGNTGVNNVSINIAPTSTGTVAFSGANTYNGATTISNGTLALGAGGSIVSSSVSISGGATFDVSAVSTSAAPYNMGGTSFAASGDAAATLNIASAGFVTNPLPTKLVLSSVAGAVPKPALTVAGGALVLSNNQFTINGPILPPGIYTLANTSGTGAIGYNAAWGDNFPVPTGTALLWPHTTPSITVSGSGSSAAVVLTITSPNSCVGGLVATNGTWTRAYSSVDANDEQLSFGNTNGIYSVVGYNMVNCTFTSGTATVYGGGTVAVGPGTPYLIGLNAGSSTSGTPTVLPLGTTNLVLIATQTTKGVGDTARVNALVVADGCSANTMSFDPISANLYLSQSGEVRVVFNNISQNDKYVSLQNGAPGLRSARILVNGTVFALNGLANGASQSVDISSALTGGTGNTVVVEGFGTAGAGAVVLIGETPAAPASGNFQVTAASAVSTFINLPALQITQSGDQTALSWPATGPAGEDFTAYQLQTSASGLPGSWSVAGTAPVSAGGQLTVTVTAGGSGQFYQLVNPNSGQ